MGKLVARKESLACDLEKIVHRFARWGGVGHGRSLRVISRSTHSIIPRLTPFVFAIAGLWVLSAMVIAVRQALGYQSTGRAFCVCVIGLAAQAVVVEVARIAGAF